MIDYCRCLKGKNDGYALEGELWVHSKCRLPSRIYWEKHVLIQRYWEELDDLMDNILSKSESADGLDKGRAENACYFIAILQNPVNPNIIGVRDEAVRRYRERHRG